ncbi:MAG TPA: acetate kinase [Clostridiaceae bacterium]|nr:acetate kinase [Clostridiaceae bacterium]
MMKILVVNAGSSSLKYQLFGLESEKRSVLANGLCERIGIDGSNLKHETEDGRVYNVEVEMSDHTVAVKLVIDALLSADHGVLSSLSEVDAVGHRVVHGGEKFANSVIIDEEVKEAIKECYPLAPLHNPANMMGIEACEKAMPGIIQVAVFDTAFHQTLPSKAYMYALPYELYEKHAIRRYGFHGTSHAFVSEKAMQLMDDPNAKIITCHLGNGSSIAAIDAGKSIDTSMGMTPLAGVPMGTRCGDIDPAVVTYLLEHENLTPAEVDNLMNKESGFFGISGVSSDCRDLQAAADEGNPRAELTLRMFGYHCSKYIGAYTAALGGLDAIVFTAGIGENTPRLREDILGKLGYLGIELDKELNYGKIGDYQLISAENSKVKVYVIRTNEELKIAQETAALKV